MFPELRTILHVDMDAFYAAVEQRDRPDLRGQPVIVGAHPQGGHGRGVVATASYEARRFGVGSAMAISQAYRLCPKGVYLPVDMAKYLSVSKEVMAIFRRFTDVVEPVSIDEAFLDVTGSRRAFGTGEEIGRRLKEAVRREVRITASVGVAPSKLVAKVASDIRKPDGLCVVEPGTEAAFLAPLPIRRLWGVGPKMEERLAKVGVQTIGDLAALAPDRLERRVGTNGRDLLLLASGVDDRPVMAQSDGAKSIGHEHTFDADTADLERLRRMLLTLADGVAGRLRHQDLRARTITLKYRDEDFHTTTHAETLAAPIDSSNDLYRVASKLFGEVHGKKKKVRLLGISASGFGTSGGQLGLFAEEPSAADQLRDKLKERFGESAVTRASLLGKTERRNPSDR